MKIRLQRFMADCGVASRRECEAMIAGGRVRVNGEVRNEMPVFVEPENDIITVDGQTVADDAAGLAAGGSGELHEQPKAYYLLNKPKGILVTNNDPANRKTVSELMLGDTNGRGGVKERVFPVGRLDMDSRGALIMTNDGELANRLTHPRYGVEKTYIVETEGKMGPGDLERMKRGMWLGPERPGQQGAVKIERFKLKVVGREHGRTVLELKISEAKIREIRRVMARLGHAVRDLNRVAIAGKVTIKNLSPGEFRKLTDEEVKWLYHASSREYHERERAATQNWFENKEMEKEAKRLATEEKTRNAALRAAAKAPPRRAVGGRARPPAPRVPYERRAVRKGRKPFVPPSGRNAGIPLGGSQKVSSPTKVSPPAKSSHPLGDAARRDDD